jgi:hypothetical protein
MKIKAKVRTGVHTRYTQAKGKIERIEGLREFIRDVIEQTNAVGFTDYRLMRAANRIAGRVVQLKEDLK